MKKFTAFVCVILIFVASFTACTTGLNPKNADITTTDEHEGKTLVNGVNGQVWVSEYEDVATNPYKAELFVRNGKFITYEGDENYTAIPGIDVSEFQGDIDWNAVANDGIQFVIVRLGYRGWGEKGIIKTDSKFLENINGARNAGLKVGVYFYSQAISVEEAVYEADYCVQELNAFVPDMPVFFDWEDSGNEDARTVGVTTDIINECSYAFCSRIEEYGLTAGVYFYEDLAYNTYNLSMLNKFCIWHAEPGDNPKLCYAINMWQYSYEGSVDGIDANVDLNLWFISKG